MTFYVVGGLAAVLILFITQRRKLMMTAIPLIKQALLGQSDMIILQRAEKPQWKRAEMVDKLTQELLAEGFSDAGAFAIDRMPGAFVRMMTGPGLDATAAVCDHPKIGAWVDISTLYEDGRIVTATTVPKTGMPSPDWSRTLRFPGEPAAKLYSELLGSRSKDGIRLISAEDAPREFEKAYFKDTVWLKQRDISLADLQKMVDERIKDGSDQTPYLTAKRAQKRHDSRERWIAAISLPIATFMLAAAYGCFILARDTRSLKLHGKQINAIADDFRITRHEGSNHYQVRYHFQADEKGPVYSSRDLFRGANFWASIQSAAFEEVQKTKIVPVVYDTKNPWNNEPAQTVGISGLTDNPWFFVLSSLPFILVGLFVLVLGLSALMLVLIG
jgi:hypothetical protein